MTSTERIDRRPSISEVRTTVGDFLREVLSDVHRVDIVGLALADAEHGVWEVEAEVWQPNAVVASLGMRTQRPVLDRERYVVRVDASLNVLAYGSKPSE